MYYVIKSKIKSKENKNWSSGQTYIVNAPDENTAHVAVLDKIEPFLFEDDYVEKLETKTSYSDLKTPIEIQWLY